MKSYLLKPVIKKHYSGKKIYNKKGSKFSRCDKNTHINRVLKPLKMTIIIYISYTTYNHEIADYIWSHL